VGGSTHRRRATFERCDVLVGGVSLGVCSCRVCVCVGVGGVVPCVCVCVCDLLICLPITLNPTVLQIKEELYVGPSLCSHSHGESIALLAD